VVSREPARAARRKVTRSNPRHESVHRGHCRGLSSPSRSRRGGRIRPPRERSERTETITQASACSTRRRDQSRQGRQIIAPDVSPGKLPNNPSKAGECVPASRHTRRSDNAGGSVSRSLRKVSRPRAVRRKRQSPVARGSDKVQVMSAVGPMQAAWHNNSWYRQHRTHPPLQRTQGRGTYRSRTGR
jgi:hypothetical protein